MPLKISLISDRNGDITMRYSFVRIAIAIAHSENVSEIFTRALVAVGRLRPRRQPAARRAGVRGENRRITAVHVRA